MISRAALSHEHADLALLAGKLLLQVQLSFPVIGEISSLRWEMTRKLSAHLAKEDRLLYPRLQAADDRSVAAKASRFAEEMGGLAAAYRHYIEGWSTDRISAEWTLFCTETKSVMAALANRIEREDKELYPMLG